MSISDCSLVFRLGRILVSGLATRSPRVANLFTGSFSSFIKCRLCLNARGGKCPFCASFSFLWQNFKSSSFCRVPYWCFHAIVRAIYAIRKTKWEIARIPELYNSSYCLLNFWVISDRFFTQFGLFHVTLVRVARPCEAFNFPNEETFVMLSESFYREIAFFFVIGVLWEFQVDLLNNEDFLRNELCWLVNMF